MRRRATTLNAYVLIHFGANPAYLELELYFILMLKKYTTNDIVYMYSSADTPKEFVAAVRGLGAGVRMRAFDDRGITFDVPYPSAYASFNTLRTCDFIFAYRLTEYRRICIIESDMVILRNIDDIFTMNEPAIVVYDRQRPGWANTNYSVSGANVGVLDGCSEGSGVNGGVLVVEPSRAMFKRYVAAIPEIVAAKCKYPNEALFKYVNSPAGGTAGAMYYNLPVRYNMSHYHLKRLVGVGAAKAPLRLSDVAVVHFNETPYKHLDIIKSPVGDDGVDWLAAILDPDAQHPKRAAVEYYYRSVYLPNVELVERVQEWRRHGLVDAPLQTTTGVLRGATVAAKRQRTPRKRCPNGTRKNRKTWVCIARVHSAAT